MNAEPVTVRRIGIGLAAVVALLTSGCAAGQVAQTAYQKAAEEGTEANLDNIALRGILVDAPTGSAPYYPVGGAATVRMVIANSGAQPDRLTGITSSAFTSWGAFGTVAEAQSVADAANNPSLSAPTSSTAAGSSPAGGGAASGATAGSSSAGASSPAGSSSAGPSSSGAASSSGAGQPAAGTSIAIPGGSRVSWGVPEAKGGLLLLHLKQRLYPGGTLVLTFTFAQSGSVTVRVPIGISATPNTSVIPAPSTGGEG